ncbi:MAG: hypothetical protein K1X29_08140 [Bdellovibrionales bacterium]|nr:hypothetical protein [Bdellovibrionales bacterium]
METEFKNMWDDVWNETEQAALLEKLKQEVRFANTAKLILTALSGNPEGATKKELAAKARCRSTRFRDTLSQLLEQKKIYKSKIGKKGMPFKYRLQPWI